MKDIEAIAAEVGAVVRPAAQALVAHIKNECHFSYCSCPPEAGTAASDWDYFCTCTRDGPAKVAALADWVEKVAPLIAKVRETTDRLDAYLARNANDRNEDVINERLAAERHAVQALLNAVGL